MKDPALLLLFTWFLLPGLKAQYPNVTVATEYEPNEPSICINPKNPMQVVAGSNTANYHYSSDGGYTWSSGIMTSTYGVMGDPVLIADTAGNFYFFHLSVPTGSQWLDRIVCQKSIDGGATWNDGSYMGLNGVKDQDKEWVIPFALDQNYPNPVSQMTTMAYKVYAPSRALHCLPDERGSIGQKENGCGVNRRNFFPLYCFCPGEIPTFAGAGPFTGL